MRATNGQLIPTASLSRGGCALHQWASGLTRLFYYSLQGCQWKETAADFRISLATGGCGLTSEEVVVCRHPPRNAERMRALTWLLVERQSSVQEGSSEEGRTGPDRESKRNQLLKSWYLISADYWHVRDHPSF